jgi:hypothetical protein
MQRPKRCGGRERLDEHVGRRLGPVPFLLVADVVFDTSLSRARNWKGASVVVEREQTDRIEREADLNAFTLGLHALDSIVNGFAGEVRIRTEPLPCRRRRARRVSRRRQDVFAGRGRKTGPNSFDRRWGCERGWCPVPGEDEQTQEA